MFDIETSRVPEATRDFKAPTPQKPQQEEESEKLWAAAERAEKEKEESGFDENKALLFTESEKFEHGQEVPKANVFVFQEDAGDFITVKAGDEFNLSRKEALKVVKIVEFSSEKEPTKPGDPLFKLASEGEERVIDEHVMGQLIERNARIKESSPATGAQEEQLKQEYGDEVGFDRSKALLFTAAEKFKHGREVSKTKISLDQGNVGGSIEVKPGDEFNLNKDGKNGAWKVERIAEFPPDEEAISEAVFSVTNGTENRVIGSQAMGQLIAIDADTKGIELFPGETRSGEQQIEDLLESIPKPKGTPISEGKSHKESAEKALRVKILEKAEQLQSTDGKITIGAVEKLFEGAGMGLGTKERIEALGLISKLTLAYEDRIVRQREQAQLLKRYKEQNPKSELRKSEFGFLPFPAAVSAILEKTNVDFDQALELNTKNWRNFCAHKVVEAFVRNSGKGKEKEIKKFLKDQLDKIVELNKALVENNGSLRQKLEEEIPEEKKPLRIRLGGEVHEISPGDKLGEWTVDDYTTIENVGKKGGKDLKISLHNADGASITANSQELKKIMENAKLEKQLVQKLLTNSQAMLEEARELGLLEVVERSEKRISLLNEYSN